MIHSTLNCIAPFTPLPLTSLDGDPAIVRGMGQTTGQVGHVEKRFTLPVAVQASLTQMKPCVADLPEKVVCKLMNQSLALHRHAGRDWSPTLRS